MTQRTLPTADSLPNLMGHIKRTVSRCSDAFERSQDPETVDNCIRCMEWALINLRRVQGVITHIQSYRALVQNCRSLLDVFKSVETTAVSEDDGYRVSKGQRGRFCVTKKCLIFLMANEFSNNEMADVLHVSRGTILNRLKEFGLSHKATYATMTDDELDAEVRRITQYNKNLGMRHVRTQLKAMGKKVQYARVMASLERVDPAAVALRMSRTITRRKYKVQGPNSFWHFDGNHKLIHWKFVTHGCIDGHTRLVLYLKVAPNNRSETLLHIFQQAVAQYGLPSRVRCDQGTENTKVVDWMVRVSGRDRGSVFIGPSTGNQRIERLWRDKFDKCTSPFYDLFTRMERERILNRLSHVHLFALHFTFLPIIQNHLDNYANVYNQHPLRTEGAQNPQKIFIKGVLSQANKPSTGVSRFLDHLDNVAAGRPTVPGVDPQDIEPVNDTQLLRSQVEVTNINCPLTTEQLAHLRSTVNPVNDCTDGLGRDVYIRVLQYLADLGL